ncbi:hypothetical protein RHGRI_003579 [Rhododendron griersonianum]|uniref:Uncharacterized protein n=1 Tax=Rhododendron griersonianum TaxID=479676 RepID=A0AAV6L6T2_9ERIC|nr:hypothetical protein RHGRI_003579 [Rhododendron griersonianum]
MDPFDGTGWDLLDYIVDDVPSTDLYWGSQSADVQADFSLTEPMLQDEDCIEKECPKKRFVELSSSLEPGRPPKNDKLAILGDAIRVVNQLRAESQEFKETNEKLVEEIKSLKAEKNELREEKVVLKEDKERIEQQLKAMTVSPPGFLPAPHPAAALPAYHAAANKMAVFPSYGYVPMWQYLPPNVLDTTQDRELRPPAA